MKSLGKMRVDGCSLKNLQQKRPLFPRAGFFGHFQIKSRFPGKIPFPRILLFNPFKIRFYHFSAFEGLFFSHFKRKRKQFLFGSPSYVFLNFGKGFLCWCWFLPCWRFSFCLTNPFRLLFQINRVEFNFLREGWILIFTHGHVSCSSEWKLLQSILHPTTSEGKGLRKEE